MCGISVTLCKQNGNSVILLLQSLAQLQNRGYDSFGMSYILNNEIHTHKKPCPYPDDKIFNTFCEELKDVIAPIAIGHTRWATHGMISHENAHPHKSMSGKICLVHNGIIENYKTLKDDLVKKGFMFRSDTDSEVVANLIDYYFDTCKLKIDDAIYNAVSMLEGTYGLAIQCIDEPLKIYVIRNGSPLLIGENDKYIMATSEASGFINQMPYYYAIENDDLIVLSLNDGIKSVKNILKYNAIQNNNSIFEMSPSPYEHWTIREIMGQSQSLLHTINNGARISNNNVNLGGIYYIKPHIIDIQTIIFLGCGTSLNACHIGRIYIKLLACVNCILCFDAADFELNDIPLHGKTLLIMCSQSGETKDLHRVIQLVKNIPHIITMGVVNVIDSLIAREVDCGIYMNAGREVAVASTKSFTSSIMIFKLFAMWYFQEKQTSIRPASNVYQSIRNIISQVTSITSNMDDLIKPSIIETLNHENIFILGKGTMEYIAKEMALKMKEMCYIHAEGYSSTALKHGPFALLTSGFPVILLIDKLNEVKMWNAYNELKCRGAQILIISEINDLNIEDSDNCIIVPENKQLQEILYMIILQHLCYRLAIARNINPDKPRNLAKVVTVE